MIADQDAPVVDRTTLTDIVTFVWETFVGGEIEPAPTPPVAASTGAWWATISIGGPWTATIVVTMGDELAGTYAAALLGLAPDELTPEDVSDAFGELANVVGGNVKGLVDDDGTSTLSLPAVSRTAPSITGGQHTVTAGFVTHGQPMVWELYERV